jgi:type I restriction enzyme, S subunit
MDWPKVKIGDLVESIFKWNPKSNPTGPPFTYIDLSSIDKERKLIHEVNIVHPSEAPSRARQLVQENDVLVSTVRPNLNGVAMIAPKYDGATASTGYCVLRPTPQKIIPSFLFHWVKTPHFISEMARNSTGANYPAVSDKIIKEHLISLPPIEEQERIANILDKAVEIEQSSEKSQEIFSQLLKGLFVDTFGDLVLNPFDHPVMKLGEICDVRDGTHDSPSYVSQGFPLITSKNLKNGSIEFESANLISRQDYDKVNQRSKVDLGDIIMPMIGTIGGPIIVNSSREFAIKNVALIKFSDSVVSNIYVKALLESYYFDYLVDRISRGGTQKFISLKNIRELAIPVPPLEEQQEFATIVNQILSIKPTLLLAKENSLSIAQELLHQS